MTTGKTPRPSLRRNNIAKTPTPRTEADGPILYGVLPTRDGQVRPASLTLREGTTFNRPEI